MEPATAGQANGTPEPQVTKTASSDVEEEAPSESTPLINTSGAQNLAEIGRKVSLWLNVLGVILACVPYYLVLQTFPPATTSGIFTGCAFLTLGASLVLAVAAVLPVEKVSNLLTHWENTIPGVFGVFLCLMLLTGHLSVFNRSLAEVGIVAIAVVCSLGSLGTVTRNHTMLYGYVVFWGFYLVLLLAFTYNFVIFARNTRPQSWQPRLTEIWEREVHTAPEVICSVQSHYKCSGFTFPCKFLPHTRFFKKTKLPDWLERPQCASCGRVAATSCMKIIQQDLSKNESYWMTRIVFTGLAMAAFVISGAFTLYNTLWQAVEADRVAKSERERDMKQAEPIVQAILQCRMMMMTLVKEMDAGKIIHQEAFTQLMLKIDAIDLSPVDEGPMKERLRLAKKQHIEQVELLSERAKTMEPEADREKETAADNLKDPRKPAGSPTEGGQGWPTSFPTEQA